jgi:hypothetical protein
LGFKVLFRGLTQGVGVEGQEINTPIHVDHGIGVRNDLVERRFEPIGFFIGDIVSSINDLPFFLGLHTEENFLNHIDTLSVEMHITHVHFLD